MNDASAVRPPRARRAALGLRGRIVGALLVTTAVTLLVAALALLGPLERLLRDTELRALVGSVRAELPAIQDLTPASLARGPVPHRGPLPDAVRALHLRTGGEVTVLAFPLTVLAASDQSSADEDSFADVVRAFRTGRSQAGFGTSDGTDVARYAVPVAIDDGRVATSGPAADRTIVVAARRSISGIPNVAAAVRGAFITAALAGLGSALLLGLVIAATLVRRLRRLRQAAVTLARGGPPIELPVTRARDEVGDLTRTFGIMQRRLTFQEEARRAFVATASHELRTPLASLDGMLELLDDDLRRGEPDLVDAHELLGRARGQARRLSRLASDLLDLSRLDAEVAMRTEPVELGELVRAVIAEFELTASERGLTLETRYAAGITPGGSGVWALADPGAVAQIARILIDNAIAVSQAGGAIVVELGLAAGSRRTGESSAGQGAVTGEATLIVRDSGPGVLPEERELIFERFKRGSAGGGRGGFGLGLAIGRELAVRMGGRLELLQNEGSGAAFILRLPTARAPAGGAA